MDALLSIKQIRADTAPNHQKRNKVYSSQPPFQVDNALDSIQYQESIASYGLSHKQSRDSFSRVASRGGKRAINSDLIAELQTPLNLNKPIFKEQPPPLPEPCESPKNQHFVTFDPRVNERINNSMRYQFINNVNKTITVKPIPMAVKYQILNMNPQPQSSVFKYRHSLDNLKNRMTSIDVYQNSNIYNFDRGGIKSREFNMSQNYDSLKSQQFFVNRGNEKFETQSLSLQDIFGKSAYSKKQSRATTNQQILRKKRLEPYNGSINSQIQFLQQKLKEAQELKDIQDKFEKVQNQILDKIDPNILKQRLNVDLEQKPIQIKQFLENQKSMLPKNMRKQQEVKQNMKAKVEKQKIETKKVKKSSPEKKRQKEQQSPEKKRQITTADSGTLPRRKIIKKVDQKSKTRISIIELPKKEKPKTRNSIIDLPQKNSLQNGGHLKNIRKYSISSPGEEILTISQQEVTSTPTKINKDDNLAIVQLTEQYSSFKQRIHDNEFSSLKQIYDEFRKINKKLLRFLHKLLVKDKDMRDEYQVWTFNVLMQQQNLPKSKEGKIFENMLNILKNSLQYAKKLLD